MLVIFFHIKNSSWKANQSVQHTAVTVYGDCLKMCEDFAPNFSDKKTGCFITTTHPLTLPFSTWKFMTKKQHGCRPHPPYFLCFPD
jgi:hypothetical protein